MAVGNAVLDVVLDAGIPRRMSRRSRTTRASNSRASSPNIPTVFEDVRGQGLMLGLKMRVPNTEFVAELFKHKMLAVGAGDNVVRLLPPLIVEEDQVREALKLLSDAAAVFEKKTGGGMTLRRSPSEISLSPLRGRGQGEGAAPPGDLLPEKSSPPQPTPTCGAC